MPALLISESIPLPSAKTADESGLVAIGGTLSCPRLIEAYSKGIFPWTENPVTWWSPRERALFMTGKLNLSTSLRRRLRKNEYKVTINRCFDRVIRSCAHPHHDEETWIGESFIQAYTDLHHRGVAHSIECWKEGELIGGLYGVVIGAMFAGESMFHLCPDASKVALVELDRHLQRRGFHFMDSQVPNAFTRQMGAVTVERDEFLCRLERAVACEVSF